MATPSFSNNWCNMQDFKKRCVLAGGFLHLCWQMLVFLLKQQVLARLVPSVKERMLDETERLMQGTGYSRDDYAISVHSFYYFKTLAKAKYQDLFKDAFLHCRAPNPEVMMLDRKTRKRLLDFQKGNRPLVLNFGSCT